MDEFAERERAFEKKFELDEELKFKIDSRSAHLFGAWAAEQLGLKGAEAETYAKQFPDLIVTKTGRNQLVKKVEQDLKDKGQVLSSTESKEKWKIFILKLVNKSPGASNLRR